MVISSYVSCTDGHCESRSQNIVSSIDVMINVLCIVTRAIPTMDIQGKLIHHEPAMVKFLRIGEKKQAFSLFLINLCISRVRKFGSSSQSFVIEPSHTSHCPSQEIFWLDSGKKLVFVGYLSYSSRSTTQNVNRKAGKKDELQSFFNSEVFV